MLTHIADLQLCALCPCAPKSLLPCVPANLYLLSYVRRLLSAPLCPSELMSALLCPATFVCTLMSGFAIAHQFAISIYNQEGLQEVPREANNSIEKLNQMVNFKTYYGLEHSVGV